MQELLAWSRMADEKPLEEQQKEKQGRWYYKVSRVRKPFEEKPLEEQQKKAKPFEEQPTTEEPLEDDQQQEERELLSVCVCVEFWVMVEFIIKNTNHIILPLLPCSLISLL